MKEYHPDAIKLLSLQYRYGVNDDLAWLTDDEMFKELREYAKVQKAQNENKGVISDEQALAILLEGIQSGDAKLFVDLAALIAEPSQKKTQIAFRFNFLSLYLELYRIAGIRHYDYSEFYCWLFTNHKKAALDYFESEGWIKKVEGPKEYENLVDSDKQQDRFRESIRSCGLIQQIFGQKK